MYTNIIGFIIVGIFIGCCLMTLISIYSYKKNCPDYVETDTGIVWRLKCKATSCVDNKPCYVMESTKDAHVETVDYLTFKKRFKE